MLKNLLLLVLILLLLTGLGYFISLKATGYTSIVIQATVASPSNASTQEPPTLTATVEQPKAEKPTQSKTPETGISATVEQKEEKKEYVNQTILLQVINQTENLKVKLDKLRTSSRTVLNYYSSINDTDNVEKWINVVVLFNQALDDAEKIQDYTEDVKDSATKENVDVIKTIINSTRETLNKIVKLIKSD